MTSLSDEKLVAYADGELSEEEAMDIRDLLRNDAEARSRLAVFESSARLAREAYSDVLREPVPEHLTSAIGAPSLQAGSEPESGGPVALAVRPGRSARRRLARGGHGNHVCPSAGRSVRRQGQQGLDVAVLNGPVTELLESKPSFQTVEWTADGGPRRAMPVATFIGEGDSYCREFELTQGAADGTRTTFAVACRGTGGTWALTAMVPAAKGDGVAGDGFQPASGARHGVEQMFEALRTGSVISAEDEAELISKSWSKAPGS